MIIGLTGRIAAGKETIKNFFMRNSFEYYTFSHVIRQDAAKIGIEITRKSLQDLGNSCRKMNGGGFWAKKIIELIIPGNNYIIDGIRNPGEIDELKKAEENIGNFYLISVYADQTTRYQRVLDRDKPSDPNNWEDFLQADERDLGRGEPEWGQQVKKCMQRADYSLNNNSTINNFETDIQKIYQQILKRETN